MISRHIKKKRKETTQLATDESHKKDEQWHVDKRHEYSQQENAKRSSKHCFGFFDLLCARLVGAL